MSDIPEDKVKLNVRRFTFDSLRPNICRKSANIQSSVKKEVFCSIQDFAFARNARGVGNPKTFIDKFTKESF